MSTIQAWIPSETPSAVVGIDFGTSNSAAAYAYTADDVSAKKTAILSFFAAPLFTALCCRGKSH
jgi:molecular chaperone DnaK (HSP70)